MGKFAAVFRREYGERVRTKWFVIATLFGPLLLGLITIVPAWLSFRSRSSTDLANTVILDATGRGFGTQVADALASGPRGARRKPSVLVVRPDLLAAAETTATHEVMQRVRSGYVVLDKETTDGERLRYAGRNATSLFAMDRIHDAVRSIVLAGRLGERGISRDEAKEITFLPLRLDPERITDRGRGGSGKASAIFAFGMAFLLYMTIVLYGQAIMRGVMEEKTTRVAEVIVSSVRPDTLLAGKVAGVGAVALTQLAVWIAAGWMMVALRGPILRVFGVPAMPFQLPSLTLGTGVILVLLFILGFVFYAGLFASVGATVNSEQEAQQAAMPVMLLVIAAAVLIQPVTLNPSGSLARWASMLPFSSPILMPIRLSTIELAWTEIAASLAILAVSCAAVLWLAARIYRVGLLMYGKRPTLREIGRWIRYA